MTYTICEAVAGAVINTRKNGGSTWFRHDRTLVHVFDLSKLEDGQSFRLLSVFYEFFMLPVPASRKHVHVELQFKAVQDSWLGGCTPAEIFKVFCTEGIIPKVLQ